MHFRAKFTQTALLLPLLAMPQSSRAQAASTTLVEPPGPLLPATLGAYAKVAPAPVGDGIGLIDSAHTTMAKEDGVKRFERSEYDAGGSHGTIAAYQFIDASGASAAFSFERSKGAAPYSRRIGDATATGPDGIVFQSGINLIVAKFDLSPAKTEALWKELISHLPKVAGPAGQPPLLPTYLPETGLAPGTARYALGPAQYSAEGGVLPSNILQFDKSGEAVTAEYATRKGPKGVLTLLLYPTPTIAGDEGRAIEAFYRDNPGALGNARLRREGPMLMLASGGFTGAEAQGIIDNIHLRNELTWNKPMPLEFHTEVRKTASLLTSIAVFSGVGALGAILLGLFLGGARAGIRVLMGKPAASEPEFLRIDLSSKPSVLAPEPSSPGTVK